MYYCRTQVNLSTSTFMHFAEPAIWPSSMRSEDPTCVNHVDVLTCRSVFVCPLSTSSVISRVDWKDCAKKLTNKPAIFVDGNLPESIKRSAFDRLGNLVPVVRARTFPGYFTT